MSVSSVFLEPGSKVQGSGLCVKSEYRITNIESRMSKEGILAIYFIKIKIERSETTLRYSTVRYSAVLRFAFNHITLNLEP